LKTTNIMAKRSQWRLRDGNPYLKGQLEDLKHIGKTTFWKILGIRMYTIGRKWHRIETVGRKPLSKPEPYIGCSAL